MLPMDFVTIGLWIVAIAIMLWLAWEPWRQTRSMLSVDLSDGMAGRPVSPLHVFLLPLMVAVGPFFAQNVGHPGPNVWRTPHVLLPTAAVELAVLVVGQFFLRRNILAVVRKRRTARAATLDSLSGGHTS